jgi:hypothetical protein
MMTLFAIRRPISGTFVFMTAIKAAYTCEKLGDAI